MKNTSCGKQSLYFCSRRMSDHADEDRRESDHFFSPQFSWRAVPAARQPDFVIRPPA